MNDSKNINDYVSMTPYQGKQDKFSLWKIEIEQMKEEKASKIRETFVEYFDKRDYKQEGITKHALDVSKVGYMDSTGLGAILAFSRLSKENGEGVATLIGCSESVERLLTIAQVSYFFNLVEKKTGL